jgi:hypothetical protein
MVSELQASGPSPASFGAIAWLIGTQLVLLMALAVWAMIVPMSLTAFDSGPSIGAGPWMVLIALWSYPVLSVGCAAWAWISFRKRLVGRAMALTTIPLATAVVAAVLVLL